MKTRIFFLLLLVVFQKEVCCAQDMDTSPVGVMISHGHPKGGWMFSYTFMNMAMKNNLTGSEKQSDEAIWNNYIFSPQGMKMNMHMLMGMYGVSGRLSLMLMADYLKSSMEVTLPPGTVLAHNHNGNSSVSQADDTKHAHATSGLGDTKLWALYKLYNGPGSSLELSAGLNFPTGNIRIAAGEHALYDGERHTYMMQLGTGTYDFLPGLTFLKKKNKLTWSAQFLSTLRPFTNSLGYRYGNEFSVNLWAAYQLATFVSLSLRAEGFEGGSIKGRDAKIYSIIEPDANPKNYGGQRASAFAGLNFYINKTFLKESKIGIEAGIPVYQNLNGPQLGQQQILHIGIIKSF